MEQIIVRHTDEGLRVQLRGEKLFLQPETVMPLLTPEQVQEFDDYRLVTLQVEPEIVDKWMYSEFGELLPPALPLRILGRKPAKRYFKTGEKNT